MCLVIVNNIWSLIICSKKKYEKSMYIPNMNLSEKSAVHCGCFVMIESILFHPK